MVKLFWDQIKKMQRIRQDYVLNVAIFFCAGAVYPTKIITMARSLRY
jgi:hypothetical protein